MKFSLSAKNLAEFEIQKMLYVELRSKLGDASQIINENGPRTVPTADLRAPGGAFLPDAGKSLSLTATQLEQLENVGGGVARIDYRGGNPLVGVGTAWQLGGRSVITNRHVLENILTHSGAKKFGQLLSLVRVGFAGGTALRPADFVMDNDYDIAVLYFKDPLPTTSLKLSGKVPQIGDRAFTIGFPGLDVFILPSDKAIFEKIFPGAKKVKRLAEGTVVGLERNIVSHSVPGSFGSSGSPLLNDDFEVIGLHFGGLSKVSNYAIASSFLETRLGTL